MKHIQLSSFLKAICPLFILCSISLAQQSGEEPAPSQPLSGIDAASALVQRVTPEYGDKVSFTISKKVKKTTIAAKDSETIVISAPSVFECARGYGYYLRHVARVHLSWNGDNKSAARFIVPKKTIVVPEALPINFAFNYCTLSYTGAHWSRAKWLKEIDRLALNGFQYVLITPGLEKVWQGFLKDLGCEDLASSFIANPCFSAWWNMGNLEGEGGPVSQQLIDSEAELGKAMADRARELGMTPVLQGYVGFVPHNFPKYTDDLLPQGEWVGGYVRPSVLRPDSKEFPAVAKAWYDNLEKVYGFRAKAFGGDLFHEGGRTGGADLGACAKAVQKAMQDFSPGSLWFLQEWGGNPKKELLDGTDTHHTVILALEKNLVPDNSMQRNYNGRRYVWCELANFGGNHGLFGGFGILEKASGDAGGASGFGLLSEGIETNPMYYELFFERINNRNIIKRDAFIKGYAMARYGSKNPALIQALSLLASSVYTPTGRREGCPESILCARPSLDAQKASTWSDPSVFYNPEDVRKAGMLMLGAAKSDPNLLKSDGFRYDLADVCRQVLAERARVILPLCKKAVERGNKKELAKYSAQFLALFPLTADILATHEDFLLGNFLRGAAKRAPENEKEMTQPLRRLVTTWSKNITSLNDYAHRQLSEMMSSYYFLRWQAFFNHLIGGGQEGSAKETVVTNNGERVVSVIRDNKSVETIERDFPSADIPLLTTPKGDIIKLAEKALKLPIAASGKKASSASPDAE